MARAGARRPKVDRLCAECAPKAAAKKQWDANRPVDVPLGDVRR